MADPFTELRQLASASGVNLLHSYIAAGLSDSTYYRHRDGRNGMTMATYSRIRAAVVKLAERRAA